MIWRGCVRRTNPSGIGRTVAAAGTQCLYMYRQLTEPTVLLFMPGSSLSADFVGRERSLVVVTWCVDFERPRLVRTDSRVI
jgi:hypothetical protein